MSEHNFTRLQRIQNYAARVVTQSNRFVNSAKLLSSLHWLPIRQRVEFKISVLTTFKTIQNKQPICLNDLIKLSIPTRNLRSANNGIMLDLPFRKTAISSRAFSHSAPKI